MVLAPETFLNTVLWPEFQQINGALGEYLAQVTDRVIREAVYKDTGGAEEVEELSVPDEFSLNVPIENSLIGVDKEPA